MWESLRTFDDHLTYREISGNTKIIIGFETVLKAPCGDVYNTGVRGHSLTDQ